MRIKQDLDSSSVNVQCDKIVLEPISQKYAKIRKTMYAEFTAEITRYMIPAVPYDNDKFVAHIDSCIARMRNKDEITLTVLKKTSRIF